MDLDGKKEKEKESSPREREKERERKKERPASIFVSAAQPTAVPTGTVLFGTKRV